MNTQQPKSECCEDCAYTFQNRCNNPYCPCHTQPTTVTEQTFLRKGKWVKPRATVAKANAIQAEDWEKRFDQYVREVVNDLGTGEIHYFGAKTEHKNGWLIASTDWVHVKDFIRQTREEAVNERNQELLELIRSSKDKGFEAQTILEVLEGKLNFDQYGK